MTVGELCTRQVVIARAAEPLLEAARRMRDHHVGSLVVVSDDTAGVRPVGFLTDRDLVVRVLADSAGVLSRLTVDDVMSRELHVVVESAPLDVAITTMRRAGVRRLPVVGAAGALVGILSLDDVLEALSEQVRGLASVPAREERRERETRP